MAPDSHQRTRATVSLALGVAGLVLLIAWLVADPGDVALLTFPSDDAFYYFTIARNVVVGAGPTFDGLTTTNGWHPLWMVCLLPVFYFLSFDALIPVRAVLILNVLMALCTIVSLYRLVHRYIAPALGLVAVGVALLPNTLLAMTNGLETGLTLLATVICLSYSFRTQAHLPNAKPERAFFFGVLIGFVTLSRLDTAFVLPAAAVVLIWTARQQVGGWRAAGFRILLQTLGFALVFGPYAAWNVWHFGQIMPISGAVKSSFPSLRNSFTLSGDMWVGLGLLCALWGTLTLSERWRRLRPTRETRAGGPVLILALGCTMHFVHALLFLDWGVYWWHFTPYGLGLALAVSNLADSALQDVPTWRRPFALGSIGFAALCVLLTLGPLSVKYKQHAAWRDAASWAATHTPPNAVFALKDAGLFGYFSQRRVVNLDGKANGKTYLNHLRQGTVEEYLREVDVSYMADVNVRYRDGVYVVAVPRVNQEPLRLTMREADEVYRSETFPASARPSGPDHDAHFGIWRCSAGRCEHTR